MKSHSSIQSVFISVWIVLIVTGLIYNLAENNFRRKQIVVRIMTVLGGGSFAVFAFLQGTDVWFLIPAVAAITLVNVFTLRICPNCGTTNRSPYLVPAPNYCRKCGTEL
jgi:hypothetical protein